MDRCTCGAELDDDNKTGYCSRECLEEDRQHDGFEAEHIYDIDDDPYPPFGPYVHYGFDYSWEL